MGQTTAAGPRCPGCSAAVRPGAPWCTQCYAPTGGPAPAAASASSSALPAAVPVVGPDAVRAPSVPSGTWPCTDCSHANDLALSACASCGTPFLDAARATPLTVVLPLVGDVLALSSGRRAGLAAGVALAFVVVLALLALLLA